MVVRLCITGKNRSISRYLVLELAEDQFITVPPGVPHLCSPETETSFCFAVLYIPIEYLDVRAPAFIQPRTGKTESAVVLDFIDSFIQAVCKNELKVNSERLCEFLEKNSSPLDAQWGVNLLGQGNNYRLTLPHGSRFRRYRYTRKLFGIGQKRSLL